MKKTVLTIIVLFSIFIQAQENYKYVIIPSQFSFFKEADKYGLNSLTKSFFETEGFTVYYDTDKLPNEILNARCNALHVEVTENNKMFTTNLSVQVKDCTNKTVALSLLGSSRDKDFQLANTSALRDALTSLKGKLKFKINENSVKQTVAVEDKESFVGEIDEQDMVVSNKNLLYALPTATGFKLVDNTPNIIFELKRTSVENMFLAERGIIDSGIFYKTGDVWYFEFYKRGKLSSETVEVKF
jgi:preprotein translocase subunit SecD